MEHDINEWIAQFRDYEQVFFKANKMTAQSVLDMAKIVADAWRDCFNDVDMAGGGQSLRGANPFDYPVKTPVTARDVAVKNWQKFRTSSRLLSKATCSQWKTIGMKYDALTSQVDHLPSSWYTLYILATLPAEILDAAVVKGVIHPAMTQGQAKGLTTPAKRKTAAARQGATEALFESQPPSRTDEEQDQEHQSDEPDDDALVGISLFRTPSFRASDEKAVRALVTDFEIRARALGITIKVAYATEHTLA